MIRSTLSICLLSSLLLAAPAGAQAKADAHPAHAEQRDSNPVEALKEHGRAIWREWESLRSAGLLANDLVFLAPPMRPEGTNSAFSEQVVDWLREGAPQQATVIHGSSLKSLLNAWFFGESLLLDSASALDLARRVQAGFVISGALRETTDEQHRKSIEVRILAQRSDELAVELDSGPVRFAREHWLEAFLAAQSKHAQAPATPFGKTRGARSIPWDDAKREELLRRALSDAVATLLERCRRAKQQGDVGVGPGDRRLLVLPALDPLGQLNSLSDTLWTALSGAFTGQTPLKSVLKRAADSNVALAWVFEPEIEPSVLEKLGLAGVVQPRFSYDPLLGQLLIEANVIDATGRAAPIEPVSVFTADFRPALESVLKAASTTELPDSDLDGETLLRDALEGLVREVLAPSEELRGKQLRLMPLETDATAEVGALFAAVFDELIGEKRRVLEAAARLGKSPDDALRTGGGELRVRLAVLGGVTYESYELAARTLRYWSWANVERSKAFELGRQLNESLVQAVDELGLTAQLSGEALTPLERLTSDPRSPDPRLTSINLAEPELVLQLRAARIGESIELRATLLDTSALAPVAPSSRVALGAARPTSVVALRRVQTRLRGDVADAIRGVLKTVKPLSPKELALEALPKALPSPTAGDPQPRALAAAKVRVVHNGRRGAELASALEEALAERLSARATVEEAAARASRARRDARAEARLRITPGAGAEAAAQELLDFIATSDALPAQARARLRALAPTVAAAEPGAEPPSGVVLVVIDG